MIIKVIRVHCRKSGTLDQSKEKKIIYNLSTQEKHDLIFWYVMVFCICIYLFKLRLYILSVCCFLNILPFPYHHQVLANLSQCPHHCPSRVCIMITCWVSWDCPPCPAASFQEPQTFRYLKCLLEVDTWEQGFSGLLHQIEWAFACLCPLFGEGCHPGGKAALCMSSMWTASHSGFGLFRARVL